MANKLNRDTSAEQAAEMALEYCINNNIMAAFFKEHRKEVIGMVLDFTEERVNEFIGKLEKEIQQKQLVINAKERELENKDRELESKNREIERLSRLLEEQGILLEG